MELNAVKRGRENEEAHFEDRQFVTFAIGNETYGVNVTRVQEIIGMTQITHVPNALSFMKGVINLRGSVVPVIDMRIKFHMPTKEYDASTVIIIVEVQGRLVGMIVDAVSDVAKIPISSIQDTPQFSTRIDTSFLEGIGQIDELLVIILDVERIMSSDEIAIATEASA